MLADQLPVHVDHRPRLGLPAGPLAQDVAVVAAGHETDLLAVALLGRCQPERSSGVTHLRLGHLAEREARMSQLLLAEAVQEVALVLLGIAAAQEAIAG